MIPARTGLRQPYYSGENFPKEPTPSFSENLSRACGYKAGRTWAEYSVNPLSKNFWAGCAEGRQAAWALFFKDAPSKMNYSAERVNMYESYPLEENQYDGESDWQQNCDENPPPSFSENLFRAFGYKAKRTWAEYPINPLSRKFWEGCAEARQAASDLFPKRTSSRMDRTRPTVLSWKDPQNLLSRHSTWAVFIRVLGWDSKRTAAGWFCSFNPYSELHTKGTHLDSMKELSARTRDSIFRGMGYDVKALPARCEQRNRNPVPAFSGLAGAGWALEGYNQYGDTSQRQDYNSHDDVYSSMYLPGTGAATSSGGLGLRIGGRAYLDSTRERSVEIERGEEYDEYFGVLERQNLTIKSYNGPDSYNQRSFSGKGAAVVGSNEEGCDLENVLRVSSTGSDGEGSGKAVGRKGSFSFSLQASAGLLERQKQQLAEQELVIKKLTERVKSLEGLLRNPQLPSNVTGRRRSKNSGAGMVDTDVVVGETA